MIVNTSSTPPAVLKGKTALVTGRLQRFGICHGKSACGTRRFGIVNGTAMDVRNEATINQVVIG